MAIEQYKLQPTRIKLLRSGSFGSKGSIMEARRLGLEGDKEMSTSDVENLEEARKLVRDLRQKTRAQAQQLLAWRRAYKTQELLISRLQREKVDQLKTLSSKLLLFESRLIRKQKDISTMLNLRENIIHRQQRIIESLTNRLIDNGLEPPHADLNELDTNILDLDSLNDSDSAVVMEDIDSDSNITHLPRFRSGGADSVTVVRSISDAIDPNLKYNVRRSNGFLRRPEILETVYSVEEDIDNENQNDKPDAIKKRDAFASGSSKAICQMEETAFQRDRLVEEKVCEVPSWPYVLKKSCRNALTYKEEDKSNKSHNSQVEVAKQSARWKKRPCRGID
ncbi:hypothetical protein AMK59_2751 [Oryctes borbonicus]|uniref:Uncharacterized protein n=1 Tax=Oryctes borbonicus TaxID=1629725 RepID=A0A0T6BH61_9SCAR|nr:hypothetical protein AMK59_2751 [Oryctes borbonicus]